MRASSAISGYMRLSHLSELMRSPVLTRYSKAPEYEYTPATRSELIDVRAAPTRRNPQGNGVARTHLQSNNAAAAVVNVILSS